VFKHVPDEDLPGQEKFKLASENKRVAIKIILILATTIIFYVVGGVPSMTLVQVDCTEDYLHGYLNFLNAYFKANESTKNLCLIVTALFSDLVLGCVLMQWVLQAKSWRFPIALIGLYLMRLLCAVTFRIRYPADYIWGNPGFPSISTAYGMANDFHFTAHIGLTIMCANELWEVRYYKTAVVALLTVASQTVLGLATRGSYSIDIAAAYLFGYFFWLVGGRLSYYMDVLVLGNCFQERFPYF